MKRQRLFLIVGLAVALFAGTAQAANLSNLNGQTCGVGSCGSWHFVNNQTGGVQTPGTLTADFSEGVDCSTGPSAINANVQHFICGGCGALLGASTNLPGRLVLSDFTCDVKKPPECDPKTQKCP